MADIRTLKLNLLADVSDFNKGLHGSQRATKTFAGKVGMYTRKAAQGFAILGAAAGAAALKISVDAVKAAMEDEASQTRLQVAMRKTIGATQDQVDATEALIRKQQFLKGFSDTQLRGAFQRLLSSTKDIGKANDLLSLSQDVARGTGKDLETVALAIGKALDGNLGALKRLGVPLDQNIIKTKDTTAALQALTDLYGGQASAYADTFAGKMATLRQRIDELKEGFGTRLLDSLNNIIPYISRVVDVLGGTADTSLSNKIKAVRRGLDGEGAGTDNLAYSIRAVADAFLKLFSTLVGGDSIDANKNLNNLATALQRVASAINGIADAYGKLDRFTKSSGYQRFLDLVFGPKGQSSPLIPLGGLDVSGARAAGGPVSANRTYLVGERGPELFTPNAGGRITPNGAMGGVTIVMNGIVDAESARRSIENLIQRSQRRSGPVNWNMAVS